MKLLAIRGRNLNSLAEAFEVDFTAPPLSGSGLFAVTGPTGAGKSTLLDALCLALYGALPRLSGAPKGAAGGDPDLSSGDARNAMRQGAGEAFAEVDFLGRAEDGLGARRRYRARWEARRARGKPDGALQAMKMRLFDLETDAPIAEKLNETRDAIAERVGLSFEQFKRSALLAQGEFEAFLAADAKERAALLERITGGEVFGRISLAAHRRASEERKAIDALEAGAAAHRPLEQEEREAAELRKTAAATAAAQAAARKDALLAVERFVAERQRLAREKSTAETEREAAAVRLTVVAAAASARLAADAQAAERDRALLAEEEERRPWGARLAGQLGQTEAALEAVAEATQAKKTLEKTQAEIETAKMQGETALQELLTKEKKRAETLTAKKEAAQKARKAVEALQPKRIESAVEAARSAADALRRLEAPLRRWSAAGDEEAAAAARIEKARDQQAGAALRLEKADKEAPDLEAAYQEARARLETWRAALSDVAEGLRATLRDGEPCPVCGSLDHATAKLTKAAKAAASEEEARLKTASKARDDVLALQAAAKADQATAAKAAETAAVEAEAAKTRRAAARKEAAKALAPWADLAKRLGAEEVDVAARTLAAALGVEDRDAGALDEAWDALERAVERHAEAIDAEALGLRTAREAAEDAEAALRAEEEEATRARETIEAARAAMATLGERLERAKAEIAAVKEKGAGAAAVLDQAFEGFLANWREQPIQKTREAARKEAAAATERRRRLAELAELAPRIAAEQKALGDLLAGRPIAEPEADADAQQEGSPGFAEASAAADALARAEARAEAAAKEEQRLLAEPPEGAEPFLATPETLPEAREKAVAEAAAATDALEAAVLTVREDDRVRAQLGEARKAIEERRAAADVWLKLDALVGSADGSKFRRFAQSLTLETLAALATKRLRDLAPRYALEAAPSDPGDPDLALIAVDRDMGDARRPVRQLSGGERFLTSLALALALSDLSSEQGVVVDSLFIDEGFGALDADSLGMALSALEALQATGRQIGVVTHVEALSERIAARIAVEPQGGGRSRVRVLGP